MYMDRNREARRTSIVGSNGFNRRRHRTSSLRGSPDEDMGLELHESMRLRERVKKDRDRDRYRDRERDLRERDSRDRDLRDRDSRERSDRMMNSVKRRRNERLINHRDDAGNDETSEESVNDDEDEDNNISTTANHHQNHNNFSFSQIHHNHNTNNHNTTNGINSNLVTSGSNHHLQQRKSFPLSSTTSNYAKAIKGPPVWRSGDEVISVSVPRKARSASTKRSNYWISGTGNNNSGGGVGDGEQIHRPTSGSPARHDVVPPSPPSYSASLRKKLKPSVINHNMGLRLKPPKAVSKPTSSNPEELEIEIAEVLYGLMTQSQVTFSKKDEVDRLSTDAKSKSFSISNSTSANNPVCVPKLSPLTAIAPKRKRPRQVPENLIYGNRSSPITAKAADQTPKSELPSPSNLEKISGENGSEMGGNSAILQVQATAQSTEPESSAKFDSESKPSGAELRDICEVVAKEEFTASRKIEESSGMRTERILSDEVSTSLQASNLKMSVVESHQKIEKFEIDLMASPPQVRSSSPEREADLDSRSTATTNKKPVISVADVELKPAITSKVKEDGNVKKDQLVMEEEEKSKRTREETKPVLANENNNVRKFDLQLDLEKPKRDGTSDGRTNAKLPVTANREDPVIQKSGQASSLPLPLSLASWPGGLPPIRYMGAPLQGVVSMDAPAPAQPIQPFFSNVGRERCATHCHIAKNIYYHQQFMKMNPYWQAASTTPLMFGSKPCSDLHSNINVKGTNNAPDNKTRSLLNNNKGSSQITSTSDSSQRKQHQQVLIQQALPPVAPNNLLGPTFIFPLNQQQAALSVRPSTGKSQTGASSTNMVGVNESQYLAILQNNGYPFPLPAAPNFRGPPQPPGQAAMPMFNGSFFPQSQQIGNASNASSSSQRPQSSGANNGSSNSEDIPSNDNHGSRMPAVNIYGQNFMMPIHPQNFALMTPFTSGNNNQVEKKTNQPQGVNPGIESLAPHHGFAMSFGPPINANPGSGIDTSSMVQTHLMYQNSPEAMRQNIQMIAAPAAQKKNGKVPEDAKSCNGGERKGLVEKSHGGVGQSIAFTRSDLSDHTTNSARPLNANLVGEISVQNAHVQAQNQQLASNNRIKVPVSSNGIVFSEQLSSSPAISAKFQDALSGFSQSLIQTSNGMPLQSQSPQWKGSSSARVAATSQTHSPLASPASTFKGLPQHSSRSQQQVHTQISFGGNQKPSTNSQGQAQTGTNSPTTSTVSRGASGSPRTSSFSGQQRKNSVSIPVQKSPSILGNPHVSSSPSHGGAKTQIQPQNSQHQQQQQLMLKNMQQGQLIFSNPLAQVQSSSNSSDPTGYYMHQQKRLDKHQATSSGGILSLSPTMANSTGTNDPAKAIAAATNNAKNGRLPSDGVFNAPQFAAQPSGTIMPGFSYIHPVPAGVQTKQSEQKKHTGNDNLHQWQPEKK